MLVGPVAAAAVDAAVVGYFRLEIEASPPLGAVPCPSQQVAAGPRSQYLYPPLPGPFG